MRYLWLLCLAAGCEFAVSPSSTPGATGAGDDAPGQDPGTGPGPGTAPPPVCDVTADPSVRLCVTFERDPMVQDLSSYAHTVTEATGITKLSRPDGSPAASLTTASRIHIADDGMFNFNVAQLTIDMWIAPAAGHPGWMLDNNTHYFLDYEADGKIRCGFDGKVATSSAAITDTTWHHVACTYGSNHELRVYVDGDRSGCVAINPGTPTSNIGIAIGANYGGDGSYTANYAGGIDNVHVYARAMSDAEICTAAGHQGCQVMNCQQGGPGPGE